MNVRLSITLLATISSVWSCSVLADFAKGKAAYDRIDYATAFKEWSESANKGDAKSQYWLGLMYAHGRGVLRDDAEALRWYRKASEQGDPNGQRDLGVAYDLGHGVSQNYAEAMNWYQKAAEQGDAGAQFNLGVMFDDGRGVPQDYAEAVKWYRKAADQGIAKAQSNLGVVYDKGHDVPQNNAEAVSWFRKAADQGLAAAQNNLGVAYRDGRGVSQNFVQAESWFRKAAEQGFADAQYNLGVMFDDGPGMPQDYAKAVKWYRQAAEQGLAKGQLNLGVAYYQGHGVSQDYAAAVSWFRKAAEQGLAAAQYNLGSAYDKGLGVLQNFAEAVKWYRKAADQGIARAQYNLGAAYKEGRGISKDNVEAYFWLVLSSGSDEKARAALGAARALLTPAQIALADSRANNWKPNQQLNADLDQTAEALVAQSNHPICSCEDTSACTSVEDVPIVFATRDLIRTALKKGGAIPIDESDKSMLDEYQPPSSKSYTKVRAYYDYKQLAELVYEYPDAAMLPHVLADYADFAAIAAYERSYGDFSKGRNSAITWSMPDGAEIEIVRNKGMDGLFLEFKAPGVSEKVDAQVQRTQAASAAKTSAASSPKDRAAVGEATGHDSGTVGDGDELSVYASQGLLEFHSDEPVLLGKSELKEPICGDGEDFDYHIFEDPTHMYEAAPFAADEDKIHVEHVADGSLRVKLAVGDAGGSMYRFLDVRPGASVHAVPDGDCRRRNVIVNFQPIQSHVCVRAHLTNQSPRSIVKRLVKAGGITVDGMELLTTKRRMTLGNNFESTAKDLLNLVQDVSELDLIEINPVHYIFRQPATKSSKQNPPLK